MQPKSSDDNHSPLATNYHNKPCNNAYTITNRNNRIKFLHQCLFIPTKLTLQKTIAKNQLSTLPGLDKNAVDKYLDESSATDKGNMKRHQQGIRSTKLPTTKIDDYMNPPSKNDTANHVFCFHEFMNKDGVIVYTDLTGKFPIG